MQQADNIFFEEYKRLNKLCSEIFSCQNGVSEYISQMEIDWNDGYKYVSSWNEDFKNLKHVRWVRNKIAHDYNDTQISNASDLAYAKFFYERIFSGTDPLSLLRKAVENTERKKKKEIEYEVQSQPVVPALKKKKSHPLFGALLCIGIGAFVFAVIYFSINYFM
mgnify:CR=1 FL=1